MTTQPPATQNLPGTSAAQPGTSAAQPGTSAGQPGTTAPRPGTSAARHGTGDADLAIMLAAHAALRRDLVRLAHVTARADLHDPARHESIAAGWDLFKHELHLHHTAEDDLIWPALRPRLVHSASAQSTLDAMEEEHTWIDPLLAAVDEAFAAQPGTAADRLPDAVDALTSTLTGHLGHEERDALPLIGVALTASEWRRVGFRMSRRNGLSTTGEMFAWMLDNPTPTITPGATPTPGTPATLRTLPPPFRLLYRARWKPRYEATPRW